MTRRLRCYPDMILTSPHSELYAGVRLQMMIADGYFDVELQFHDRLSLQALLSFMGMFMST